MESNQRLQHRGLELPEIKHQWQHLHTDSDKTAVTGVRTPVSQNCNGTFYHYTICVSSFNHMQMRMVFVLKWKICTFLPAVSRGRPAAGRRGRSSCLATALEVAPSKMLCCPRDKHGWIYSLTTSIASGLG